MSRVSLATQRSSSDPVSPRQCRPLSAPEGAAARRLVQYRSTYEGRTHSQDEGIKSATAEVSHAESYHYIIIAYYKRSENACSVTIGE
jgi:tRNA(Ile2) C34 agmatinyltransferase TiaS